MQVGSWITGRRRDQGGMRTELPILELDVDGNIFSLTITCNRHVI